MNEKKNTAVDKPIDVLTMRLGELKAMLLAAGDPSFIEGLHTLDQEYYFNAAFNLVNEAIEASKKL